MIHLIFTTILRVRYHFHEDLTYPRLHCKQQDPESSSGPASYHITTDHTLCKKHATPTATTSLPEFYIPRVLVDSQLLAMCLAYLFLCLCSYCFPHWEIYSLCFLFFFPKPYPSFDRSDFMRRKHMGVEERNCCEVNVPFEMPLLASWQGRKKKTYGGFVKIQWWKRSQGRLSGRELNFPFSHRGQLSQRTHLTQEWQGASLSICSAE